MSDKHYVGLDLSSYEDNGSKYAISRVTLITADNEYFTAGDDTGLEITAECPYATQAMVDAILAQLKGYKFQGYSAESANLDPAAELGDGITASGIYSVIGKISDDGNGYVDVSAPGEAELDEEYPTIGPQTQEFQRNLQATRKQIEDNNRDLRLAIENATEYITGNEGGYVLIRLNDEKKPYEILIMDTDDINTAKNVWRWNKSGFGHSNSGYEGPYETAITQDGSIVATYITTGVLNAVLIQTGILKSKDGETFYLDLDEGILKLKATELSISGQTVEEIAKSKADSALSSAKSYADSAASGAFNSLTQQQIFNKLTGGGSNQGIYLENGRVYINADYVGSGTLSASKIYGGTLTVGGSSNGNGILRVLSSGNVEFGKIDNTGFTCSGDAGGAGTGRVVMQGSLIKFFLQNNSFGSSYRETGYISPTISYSYGTSPRIGMSIRNESGGFLRVGGYSYGDNTSFPNEFSGALKITGAFSATGEKNRIINTKNYGNRLQYCYETASPMFGDSGEGETDSEGICYVYIDDVFLETVDTKIEYQVFLQKEGPGDIWISKKTKEYFVVNGTKNLKFAWEIKAAQYDLKLKRLEQLEEENEDVVDYEGNYQKEIEKIIEEQEAMLYETA